jgi:fumarate hydratase class II
MPRVITFMLTDGAWHTRTESDTFGPIEVDASRYWGAQAQRSLGNFKIGWEKQPQPVVRALGIVKRAAAETNMDLGKMDPSLGKTIVAAARKSSTASSTTTSRWSSGRPAPAPSPT